MKCEHCPVKCGECIAEKTKHFAYCNKSNPNHNQYSKKYIDLILHLSCGAHYTSGTHIIISEHEEKKEYPGVGQQAKNLFGSVSNFIKSGMHIAEESIYQKRLEVCNNCEWFDHEAERCRKCGCFVKIKARLMSDKCPLNKWDQPENPKDSQADIVFTTSEIVHSGDCGCNQS